MGAGASFGFIKDGLQRMAQNWALLNRKDVYKEYVNHGGTKKSIYQFKQATPEILEAIRTSKRAELVRNRQKSLIIGAGCAILVAVAFWMMFS